MKGERHLVEVYADGIQTWPWDDWKANYISVQNAIEHGSASEEFTENAKEHYKTTIYYIREEGTQLLSPPLVIKDIPCTLNSRHPNDMHRVALSYVNGPMYRHDSYGTASFDYSPWGGYEVPPEHILDAGHVMTVDALRTYKTYYQDGPGFEDLRSSRWITAEGTVKLHDLRHRDWLPNRRGYGDINIWGISRQEESTREVYTTEGVWVPTGVGDEKISMGFVNQYSQWGFKWGKALDLIAEFSQPDSEEENDSE